MTPVDIYPSLRLCRLVLNSSEGKEQCAKHVSSYNIVEGYLKTANAERVLW